MIGCICSNEYAEKKLIFTNSKVFLYQKIIPEVRRKCEERGKLYEYTLGQSTSKFKALVSICMNTFMLRKTSSGIKNFIEEKDRGKWLFTLLSIMQCRESCQPTQGIKTSASLQKEQSYFSDEEENENSSSISSKSKE